MANHLMLKGVEQFKTALKASVDTSVYNNLIKDYDLYVKNKLTNEIGHARTCNDDPNIIYFTVTDSPYGYSEYKIPRRDFDKYFELTLKCELNQPKKSLSTNTDNEREYVVCIICDKKEYDEIEIFSHRDQPYTCHDCIEQFEYV